MRLLALEAGNVVAVDQSVFSLEKAATPGYITLIESETGIRSEYSIAELEGLW